MIEKLILSRSVCPFIFVDIDYVLFSFFLLRLCLRHRIFSFIIKDRYPRILRCVGKLAGDW